MKMDNYTPQALRVIELARQQASKHGEIEVRPEHIAEAMVAIGEGVHFRVWESLGFDIEIFRLENINRILNGARKSSGLIPLEMDIPFDAKVKTLHNLAEKAAKRLNHTYIGPEHLLLAFLEMETASTTIMTQMGLTFAAVERAIMKELDFNLSMKGTIITAISGEIDCFALKSAADEVGFQILIDPGNAPAEVISEVLDAISELNRAVGGNGMIFVDCPDEEKVYSGAVV